MSDEDNFRSAFANALASTEALAGHLDEDSSEYMLSILLDDPSDEDAREAVTSIIASVVDEENASQFFAALDACSNTPNQAATGNNNNNNNDNDENELPRLLDNAITLKSQDIQSFASGLVADKDSSTMDDPNTGASDIQKFYANMIDVSNVQGRSERDRRKARQKEIRERMEEEENKRAIEDAMRMMAEEEESANTTDGGGGGGGGMSAQEMSEMTNATDNAADVRLEHFNLPNRKGGGQDLLDDASLILARGRRYGLMGRNGCGKVGYISWLYYVLICLQAC